MNRPVDRALDQLAIFRLWQASHARQKFGPVPAPVYTAGPPEAGRPSRIRTHRPAPSPCVEAVVVEKSDSGRFERHYPRPGKQCGQKHG